MAQHFLLSTAARTLSIASVARMTEDEARDAFKRIRWSDTKGEPHCPRCGCFALYEYKTRQLWKCKSCNHQFSVTSGTIFASRKMPVRDYLLAIAIFVNGAKGHSALQLSRDLDCQYKSAYVLSMKLREAITVPRNICGGDGVAGRQPACVKWRPISLRRRRGTQASGVASVEGILAAPFEMTVSMKVRRSRPGPLPWPTVKRPPRKKSACYRAS